MEVIFQIKIFCALLVHGFSLTTTPITGPIFKKLGSASFGKSLGHLHHSLNISDLLFHHHVLRKSLDGPLRQLNSSQFASISNLAKLAQKELELIDDNENEIMLAFNLSPHQRPRRQLNPFMALASTGLSVYTLYELQELRHQVQADKSIIASAIKANREVLMENNDHIHKLEHTVNHMEIVENEILTREKGCELKRFPRPGNFKI